jgi:hypothetical protein
MSIIVSMRWNCSMDHAPSPPTNIQSWASLRKLHNRTVNFIYSLWLIWNYVKAWRTESVSDSSICYRRFGFISHVLRAWSSLFSNEKLDSSIVMVKAQFVNLRSDQVKMRKMSLFHDCWFGSSSQDEIPLDRGRGLVKILTWLFSKRRRFRLWLLHLWASMACHFGVLGSFVRPACSAGDIGGTKSLFACPP